MKSIINTSELIKGEPSPMIRKMIGQKFGRLMVSEYSGFRRIPSGAKYHYITCVCDCGKTIIGNAVHIYYGAWKSCGCLRLDKPNRLKHGYAKTSGKRDKIYTTWQDIHKRCNPNAKENSARKYIERGIKVCDGWSGKGGFENFKNDMMPITGKSIDRIENNLHYSCGHCNECISNNWKLNCRWADDVTQSNNRGDFNNYVTIDGIKMTYRQADRYLGFRPKTLQSRIKNLGWSEERAISTPIRKIKKCHA